MIIEDKIRLLYEIFFDLNDLLYFIYSAEN